MTHHDAQAFQRRRGMRQRVQGIITGIDERGSQQQIFCRIAAQSELGRDQQTGAAAMGLLRRVDDSSGIARHVAHHKIELGDANWDGHGA